MRNIEKALESYTNDIGPKVSNEVLVKDKSRTSNEKINIIFRLINEQIDKYDESTSLDKVHVLLEYLNSIIENVEGINRKVIGRKLLKLEEKLSTILIEKKNSFVNIEKVELEFGELETIIEDLETNSNKVNSKKYDFIAYLIKEVKNLEYLEYTTKKLSNIINSKDKDEKSLFRNVISKYISSIENVKEDDIKYYSTIISFILSRKELILASNEKREILSDIYKCIDKMSSSKKQAKEYLPYIKYLSQLANSLNEMNDSEKKIEELSKIYKIPISFTDKLIEEAKLSKITSYDDRVFIDDYIITIDSYGTVEVDDGLSCKKLPNGNYLYGIHIASPLGYFNYDSEMVSNALLRGKSIHLPVRYRQVENDYNKIIPIFPYHFSVNTASLIPGANKYARSYYFEIDSEGNVVDEKFLKTIIKSSKKTNYKEITEIMEKGTDDEKLQELVKNLEAVTERLKKKYKPTKLYESIKENNEDCSELKVNQLGSEKLVYYAMLLTGNRVAEYFANSKEGYPCLYRIHKMNEKNNIKLQAMLDELTKTYGGEQYKKLCTLLGGIYPKGSYGTSGSHQGLNIEHYCHCTSSLRRGPDIVVEHALEICYDKKPTDKEIAILEAEIDRVVSLINDKIKSIEWFVNDYARSYQKKR